MQSVVNVLPVEPRSLPPAVPRGKGGDGFSRMMECAANSCDRQHQPSPASATETASGPNASSDASVSPGQNGIAAGLDVFDQQAGRQPGLEGENVGEGVLSLVHTVKEAATEDVATATPATIPQASPTAVPAVAMNFAVAAAAALNAAAEPSPDEAPTKAEAAIVSNAGEPPAATNGTVAAPNATPAAPNETTGAPEAAPAILQAIAQKTAAKTSGSSAGQGASDATPDATADGPVTAPAARSAASAVTADAPAVIQDSNKPSVQPVARANAAAPAIVASAVSTETPANPQPLTAAPDAPPDIPAPGLQAQAKIQAQPQTAEAADDTKTPADPSLPRNPANQPSPTALPEPLRALAATLNPASLHARTAAESNPVPLTGTALAVEIMSRVREGMRRFDIRLDPPELGRIDVRLDVDRNGHATTRMTVDRQETLDLLQREARGLERALQSAGLKTEQGGLEFSLRYQMQDGTPDPQARHFTEPRSDLIAIDDGGPALAAALQHYALAAQARGGIDISV